MAIQRIVLLILCIEILCSYCGVEAETKLRKQNSSNRAQLVLLENSLDLHVDPCDDFYRYACGNWEFNQHNNVDYQEIISQIDYYTNKDIARILSRFKRIKSLQGVDFIQKAFNFYKSCLNVQQYEPIEYLNWLAKHRRLDWSEDFLNTQRHRPSSNDDEQRLDWLKTLAIMRQYGMNGIFLQLITMPRRDNVSLNIIDLDMPTKETDQKLLTFKDFNSILRALGWPIHFIDIRKMWMIIHNFEKRVKDLEDIIDSNGVQLMKIGDLPMNWLKRYLQLVLNETNFDSDMEVYIQNIPYLKAVYALVNEYKSRFIVQYLHMRFLMHMTIDGPQSFSHLDCIAYTRTAMPLAMHWLYKISHPKMESVAPKVQAIFKHLIDYFTSYMTNNTNDFTNKELDYLLKKLATIQLKIGNLPQTNAQQKLQIFYRDIMISNYTDFYGNHMKLMNFNTKVLLDRLKLKTPNTVEEFINFKETQFPAYASPYFLQRSNIVILPQSLLTSPFYNSNLDEVFQYSLLGFLLAHEITHAFDYMGLDVDHTGKMSSGQFTDSISSDRFKSRIACIRHLNPSAVDEKIADINGLRLAYEAYLQHDRDSYHNQTFNLAGETFTKEQIFFLNFAQFFCTSRMATMIDTSEHGADDERLTDAIRHLPQFAKIFDCPLNSDMRLQTTCQLWR